MERGKKNYPVALVVISVGFTMATLGFLALQWLGHLIASGGV